jgi:dienelactone hydrolase
MILRALALSVLALTLSAVEITVSAVDYQFEGTALRGTLAVPVGATNAPGVLVVHEWWGRNDYADRRASELAKAGYVAFALDMYGAGKVATDPAAAGALAKPFYADRSRMVAVARAGLAQLAKAPGVDAKRLSAIGFCFGGTVVLELARAGEPLQLAASFHGGLKTTTTVAPGAIAAQVLVLHGGADPFVPPADVAGFFEEMTAAKANWRFEAYGGALHAFTNPAADGLRATLPGVGYDADAESRAFAALFAALPPVVPR